MKNSTDELLIVKPLVPRGRGWVQWVFEYPAGHYVTPYAIERWYHRGQETQVLSAIEVVPNAVETDVRPEYHLSVSGVKWMATKNYRCSDSRARWVLKEFGLEGFFEDNHVPGGLVRNYWRPVADSLVGQVCPCVDEEPTMREMQGDYVWRGAKP